MLVLVEMGLQWFARLPFSDRLYWLSDGHVKARLEPGQPVVNTDGNPLRINHLGFRGRDWSWNPEAGTLRLIVLGGSAAFCFQVADDAHTWPALLEKHLNERLDISVEVANLGLPGYDTSNSKVHYLFTGRALNPHAVLVYHTWNDLKFLRPIDNAQGHEIPRVALSGRSGTGRNPSALARLFRELQIVRRADHLLTKMRRIDVENRYTSMEKEGGRAHDPIGDQGWDWFEQNFLDVANFAKSDGVLPVFVSQATLAHEQAVKEKAHRLVISNDYVGMTLPRLALSYRRGTEIIQKVATRTGSVFVNGYDAVPPDLIHFKDHVHLLNPGAERLAQVIADALLGDNQFLALVDQVAREKK
jgi:hypothetical protein